MDALFRFASKGVELSIEGSETFVHEQIRRFLPASSVAVGRNGATSGAHSRSAPSTSSSSSALKSWFETTVPSGKTITMQDAILVFAYFLKRQKDQHMFRPADMKRAFREVGRRVPKSLLQIMGTLKRDHELLWSPQDRRGVYALSPKGIKHVEGILGTDDGAPTEAAQEKTEKKDGDALEREIEKAPALHGDDPSSSRSSSERWSLLFKGDATKRGRS